LLDALIAAGHECCADGYVIEEARRNLAAKSPESIPVLNRVLSRIQVAQVQAPGTTSSAADVLPEKDRPVLLAAIRLNCDVLVTGDRAHFGAIQGKTFDGVTIHSPRSIAEALLR